MKYHQEMGDLFVADKQGIPNSTKGSNIADRDYFQQVIRRKEGVISKVITDKITDKPNGR